MPGFIDSADRAFGRALKTGLALPVQAIGMDIRWPLTVGLQFQIDDKAAATVDSPFFGDEEVMHSECAQPCSIGHVPVGPGAVIRCRPIGALIMKDEEGLDEKILAVPVNALHYNLQHPLPVDRGVYP